MNETVSTSKRGYIYKKVNLFANIMFIASIFGVIGYNSYETYRKEQIYDALYISFSSVKEVEYGSSNYDTLTFVENVENGEISNYTSELDTSTLGVQQLKYEVTKDDVTKEFTIEVEVKDTVKPKITFNKDTITIYSGNTYAYKNNIKSVLDKVDGNLKYVDKAPEVNTEGYYTISSNFVKNKVGTYTVTVVAVDKNGNEEKASYNLKVIAKPAPKVVKTTTVTSTYNKPSSVDTSSVVNAARSLLGSKYVYAGSSPSTGFDCSGFVSYVYRLFGKNLSRTAAGIAKNGNAVSRSNMQPGDIIVWSTRSDNVPTHVSLYVGNNTMIHAANPKKGVISSDVTHWEKYGGGHIVTIRRV